MSDFINRKPLLIHEVEDKKEKAIDVEYSHKAYLAFPEQWQSYHDKGHPDANGTLQSLVCKKHPLPFEQQQQSTKNESQSNISLEVSGASLELLSRSQLRGVRARRVLLKFALANRQELPPTIRHTLRQAKYLSIHQIWLVHCWRRTVTTFVVYLTIFRGISPETIRPCTKREVRIANIFARLWGKQ